MGRYRAVAAEAELARAQAGGCDARGAERDPLHGALRRRMAHAAEGLPALADGLLVVPALCAADGPGAYSPGSQPECRGQRQPDGEGAGRHSRSLAQGHPLLQDRQATCP